MRPAILVVAAALLLASTGTVASAETPWKPDRVELVVATAPGSGFDRPARLFQKLWQDTRLVDVPTTVVNKPGGFGAIGWSYLNQHVGNGDYLAVVSVLLLTDHLNGNLAMSYQDVTPLAIIMSEEIVFAVNAESPIKSGSDFIERLRRDPSSLSIALSGVGGQNHVALGLVGKAAGIDITKLKIVGFSGGSAEAVTPVLGGHIDAVVSPAFTVAAHISSGSLRAIGIMAEQRLGGVFAETPTWREQGIDAVFSNWRGIIGPKGMMPAQIAYWDGVLSKTTALPGWKDQLAREQVGYRYLDSAASREFLAGENEKLRLVLKDLGLTKE